MRIAVAILALFLAAGIGCDKDETVGENVSDTMKSAGQKMEEEADDVGGAIDKSVEKTKDAAHEAKEETGEALEKAGEKLQN